MKKHLIALVEPSFYGLGYVDAVLANGDEFVAIVTDVNNPVKYGYNGKQKDIIVADIRDSDAMIAAIQRSPYLDKIDAIISATDYATHLTSKVAEYFNLKKTPYAAALAARRKDIARETYVQRGVPSAKFIKVKNSEQFYQAAKNIGYPVIIKPTDCSSSQHVYLIKNDQDLTSAIRKIKDFDETYLGFKTRQEYLIEEYLVGPEFSVELFLVNSQIGFASLTEKILSLPPFFVEIGHVVPSSVFDEAKTELIDIAYRAVLALGFVDGACHVELRLTQRGPAIIEVNGRSGGDQISTDLLINAFGMNMFLTTVRCHLNQTLAFPKTNFQSSAIAYLVATQSGKIGIIEGVDTLASIKGIIKHNIGVKRGDFVRIPENSSDRLGYVISVAKNPILAKKIAFDAVNSLNIEYL